MIGDVFAEKNEQEDRDDDRGRGVVVEQVEGYLEFDADAARPDEAGDTEPRTAFSSAKSEVATKDGRHSGTIAEQTTPVRMTSGTLSASRDHSSAFSGTTSIRQAARRDRRIRSGPSMSGGTMRECITPGFRRRAFAEKTVAREGPDPEAEGGAPQCEGQRAGSDVPLRNAAPAEVQA